MSTKVLTFLILCFTSAVFAEDFKTVNGKEYKDATVTHVEPDGIVVKTNTGVTKIYFTELPKEVQQRFHYDPAKAASYSAEQAANYTAYQKQLYETRYGELQKQEDDLLRQIGQAKQPGPEYRQGKSVRHQPNPQKSQLPVFESHLKDVRREKSEVRKQLEKAQH
jgi:hypothetical protein